MSDAGIYWEQQFRAKVEELAFANQAWRATYEQLAAERALCDRARPLVDGAGCDHSEAFSALIYDWLADYDAHRAAERSDG